MGTIFGLVDHGYLATQSNHGSDREQEHDDGHDHGDLEAVEERSPIVILAHAES